LSDAKFFWEIDLRIAKAGMNEWSEKLNKVTFHNKLGSQSERIKRISFIASATSRLTNADMELTNKAAMLCKVDLSSEMVGEFAKLQGLMGSYYAAEAGLPIEIGDASKEHYSPQGPTDAVPSAPVSISVALADKIDTLTGFWLIDEKPTGPKDPFALRRLASGIIKTIVENKKDFKIRDLISYSAGLYLDQGFEFENKSLQNELVNFLMDRLKFYMKEEKIRSDIILASTSFLNLDQSVIIFGKAKSLNKFIDKPNGIDVVSSFKRASSILESELKDKKLELSNTTDPGIFKTEFEKNLYKKIVELKKYFQNINKDEDFDITINNLAESKKVIFDFFDNVIVNEDDITIKKNRLELIQMLCKTFDYYVNFSLIDSRQ
jgi:glycyl-tRNA synthetase beta chain